MVGVLKGKVVLVTGGSRGVGAATVKILAGMGADVVINYRHDGNRADKVVRGVLALGRKAAAIQANLTDPDATKQMFETVAETFDRLDVLVLNANDRFKPSASAATGLGLDHDAQLNVMDLALPLMPVGGRVVFVTSHAAHFDGERNTAGFEPVAVSAVAGGQALRARIPELQQRGIRLVVVSGGTVQETVAATQVDDGEPGACTHGVGQAHGVLSIERFAAAIAAAAYEPDYTTGTCVYVGVGGEPSPADCGLPMDAEAGPQ